MALKTFLTNIAHDHAAMAAFKADPEKAMKDGGLAAHDIQLIKNKDAVGLASKLKVGGVGKVAADAATVVVIVL